MKIGLVVAIEMDAIFAYYGQPETLPCPAGFSLYRIQKEDKEIYVLHTGMGEIAAAAGTQYLITACGVDVIANFGVVGGLSPEMSTSKVCVVRNVVHFRYDCSEFMDLRIGQVDGHPSIFLPTDEKMLSAARTLFPGIKEVTCCSSDKFIGREEDKKDMHVTFSGDVCDMESAGIVLTCEANGTPCILLKAVADSLGGGAREFYDELRDAAAACLRVADGVIAGL